MGKENGTEQGRGQDKRGVKREEEKLGEEVRRGSRIEEKGKQQKITKKGRNRNSKEKVNGTERGSKNGNWG